MTVTVAGRERTWAAVQLRTWPQAIEARIDKAEEDGISVDDPAVLEIAGNTALTAVVVAVRRTYRHVLIDLLPPVLLRLSRDTVGAIPEGMTDPAGIARMILDQGARFDGGTGAELVRWSTRTRRAGWAWESLVATIADRMGLPVTWRYSARDDLVVVEPDRENWPMADPGRDPLRYEGSFAVYPETALIQCGDRLTAGYVTHVETVTTDRDRLTMVRTAPVS